LEWRVHLGTEHSIDDKSTAGSLQIIHTYVGDDSKAEPVAIIGVGLRSGAALGVNEPSVDRMLSGFINQPYITAFECGIACNPNFFWEGTAAPNEVANPYDILPEMPTFYQYEGSTTTPPCTENVLWNVLSEYVDISVSQEDTISLLIF
jgi:hypothetical protein